MATPEPYVSGGALARLRRRLSGARAGAAGGPSMCVGVATVQAGPRECLAGLALAAFASYYLIQVVRRPILVCRPGPFRDFIQRNVQLLNQKFWPTLWCFESRLQTIIASLLRGSILADIKYKREILKLADGGEVALDWMDQGCDKNSPIVIILPGLTGASQAEYIKCLVKGGLSIGVRTVIFNNRGLGGLELKTPRLYCAANYEDLSEVIKYVHENHPTSPIGATGISMGGLILGNYLAGKGAGSGIVASLIISVPWNVFKGSESIEKPYLNSLLCKHLAGSLVKTIANSELIKKHSQGRYDFDEVLQSKTIRQFDSLFTSKNFGYKDVDDYYSAATLHNKLHMIETPMLCLNAADDPFQPLEAIPIEEAEKSDHVAIVITARGGHIGFMEGLWPGAANGQYMTRLYSQYFQAIFRDEEFSKLPIVTSTS